jgi:hypothetical protein
LIGILVAFASIGAIFWWSLGQGEQESDISLIPSPSPTATVFERVPASGRREGVSPVPDRAATEIPISAVPSPGVTVVPVPSRTETTSSTSFTDVAPNYWATPFIAVVTRRGILQGLPDGTFGPERVVTRAEFAKMLRDAFERSKTRGRLNFKDLPAGNEATGAIDEAVEMEFMKGYPGEVFRPDRPITRVEVIVALANGLKLPRSSNPLPYRDADEIPAYARDPVAAATGAGLVVTYPDPALLAPRRELTRAEAAAFIHQALASSGRVEKISSPYIARPD